MQLAGRVLPSVGHATRQPSKKLPSSGQISTQLFGSRGPTLPSGHVGRMLLMGADVGVLVRRSGQHASRQPSGSVLDPGSQIREQVPGRLGSVTGQRSIQKAGRVPVSGHTVTHLLGSSGPGEPSGHVGIIF
jgi:hypothetical protein